MNIRELKMAHKRQALRLRHEEDLTDAILARLASFTIKEEKNLSSKQVMRLDKIINLGTYRDIWV